MRWIFQKNRWRWVVLVLVVVVVGTIANLMHRATRLWSMASDFQTRIRYLVETGQTIGEKPASEAFSVDYLQTIFGDNPELLENLKAVVQQGLAKDSTLTAGEVTALLVTYRLLDDGSVADVIVHAVGGFPAARKRPGFHRNGYFFHQIDSDLWTFGNLCIGFLGRDVIVFGVDEAATERQRLLLDSIFSGEIMTLVQHLEKPLYFSLVLPDPRQAVPPQLRHHVQAVVIKGYMSHTGGRCDVLILTPSPRSSRYALNLFDDMKTASEVALRTKWQGVPKKNEWGQDVYDWWAVEMVNTMEKATLEQEFSIIRMGADFGRVMVNAILKSIERMSRDLAAMQGIEDDRLDPRLVDARLKTSSPLHYWSEQHQWGPNWPIPATVSNLPPFTPFAVEPASAPAAPAVAPVEPAPATP
ncbi:MAG: hypothetical protein KJ726_06210 [Verrucomicrobia bacterium]|nr:hypothetical protein [Verrucomicrobiota bacterium]MBU1909619.1 hypothetical protein [Verrucomicrobiota bacterium]